MANAIPVTGRAVIPAEAVENGGKLNETTPAEQRLPKSNAPQTDSPIIGENDSYLPASYPVTHTAAFAEGRPPRDITLIRTDR